MMLYIVELEMDASLREEYLTWLDGHVHEMLTLPGFEDAEILVPIEPPPPAGRFIVLTHYRLRYHAAWEAYLADNAQRMRAAGLRRFGDQVRATRRVLQRL